MTMKQQKAKTLKVFSRIFWISVPIWAAIAYLLLDRFLVTGLPLILLLTGLGLLFDQAYRKEKSEADTPVTRNPFGTYMAVMFILTYSIIPLGCLIISSLIIVGITMDYVYAEHALSSGSMILFFAVGALAMFAYFALSLSMVSAIKIDHNMFNLKREQPSSDKQLSFMNNKQSKTMSKTILYAVITLIVSVGIGILTLKGFINIIHLSGSDITFLKVFWMTLTVAAFTAPFVALISAVRIRNQKYIQSKFFVSSLFMKYVNWLKTYQHSDKIDIQITEYQKGFMKRYEQVKNYSDQLPKKESQNGFMPTLKENIDQNLSVLQQGDAFALEINKANDLISDERVTDNLNIICKYINDIFILASKNKAIEHQIRKFANIYLPQTLKLCNLYIDLDAKQAQTEYTKQLKTQIAKSITNAKNAFANFEDKLMQQSSINIEAEIVAFEQILTMDGLLNKQEFNLPEQETEEIRS